MCACLCIYIYKYTMYSPRCGLSPMRKQILTSISVFSKSQACLKKSQRPPMIYWQTAFKTWKMYKSSSGHGSAGKEAGEWESEWVPQDVLLKSRDPHLAGGGTNSWNKSCKIHYCSCLNDELQQFWRRPKPFWYWWLEDPHFTKSSALNLHPPPTSSPRPGPHKHRSQGPVSSVYTSHWAHREICRAADSEGGSPPESAPETPTVKVADLIPKHETNNTNDTNQQLEWRHKMSKTTKSI